MEEKKEYRIKVQGQLIPVTEEVYLTYYRMTLHDRKVKILRTLKKLMEK